MENEDFKLTPLEMLAALTPACDLDAWPEDIYDACGGNCDDAYYRGYERGKTQMQSTIAERVTLYLENLKTKASN